AWLVAAQADRREDQVKQAGGHVIEEKGQRHVVCHASDHATRSLRRERRGAAPHVNDAEDGVAGGAEPWLEETAAPRRAHVSACWHPCPQGRRPVGATFAPASLRDQRARTLSAARIASTGAGTPHQRSNAAAPCAISIGIPSTAGMPRARALATHGVGSVPYTMSSTAPAEPRVERSSGSGSPGRRPSGVALTTRSKSWPRTSAALVATWIASPVAPRRSFSSCAREGVRARTVTAAPPSSSSAASAARAAPPAPSRSTRAPAVVGTSSRAAARNPATSVLSPHSAPA